MTRDEIIRMAQDVGLIDVDGLIDLDKDGLERFVDVLSAFHEYGAAAEREACALIIQRAGLPSIATTIRARGRE